MSSTDLMLPDSSEDPLEFERTGARILVIEDDDDLRALIAKVLRDDGFEVMEAENGRVGVDLVRGSARR